MKINEIVKLLKADKSVDEYEIKISKKNSRELFYVLKNLELNRATNIEDISVVIYINKNDFKGSSIIKINSSDNLSSVKRKIADGVKKASTALNPYYPLASKTKNINTKCKIKGNLNTIALNVGKAIFEADIYENGWINSTEVFVSKVTNIFINSNGIKHIYENFSINVEVIPTWSNKKEEFELYKWFEQSSLDYSLITKQVDEILTLAQARSCAKKLKDVKIPKNVDVLIQNDMLQLLTWNFACDIHYQSLYSKMNHFNLGQRINNGNLSINLKGVDNQCVNSCPIDGNGVVLKNINIIKNGKVIKNWGDIRHSYYFKKKPTGNYNILELSGKVNNYKKRKHLIICNFSSPQLDEGSGYWGGEVRLALYFDGKKYIPISNFSIAGNIYNDVMKMEVSKETTSLPDYVGPKYLIFKGINIF